MSGLAASGPPSKPERSGGVESLRVAEATGLSRITIRAGLSELDPPASADREAGPPGGYADRGADESPWPITTRTCCVTWRPWSIR